ncbi:MAG TPA: hypothetical protein VHM90_01620, partial [Phycisphaerae bacterium]|nr:hypothetical protein [Phycisphaerae bacterium]
MPICRRCRSLIAEDAPGGYCAACRGRAGFVPEMSEAAAGGVHNGKPKEAWTPPSLSELTPFFP